VGPEAIRQLRDAIRRLHGCESRYVEAVPVTETHEGGTVWSGIVHVLDLIDCPKADRAYAWAELLDETGRQRFSAVLGIDPINTPQDAVRASIVAKHRDQRSDQQE
jgi:hypothetical protein